MPTSRSTSVRFVSTLVLVVLLSQPSALAWWASRGALEPDTMIDVSDGFLPLHPPYPGDPIDSLYFNAFKVSVGNTNPNVAQLQLAFPSVVTNFNAILGAWRDCNLDGYIGLNESALYEYPVSQTVAGRVIPTYDPRICPYQYHAPGGIPVHNDGSIIREFLAIGPTCNLNQLSAGQRDCPTNGAYYGDDDAKVWGDNGRPNETKPRNCPTLYLPGGTLQTTGGIIRYGQCQLTSLAPGLPRPPPDACSVLATVQVCNQPNPYGTSNTTALKYKCTKVYQVQDPVTGQTYYTVPGPDIFGALGSPPSVQPGGSLHGTVQYTFGDCGGNYPSSYDIYEATQGAATSAKKTSSDWDFVFYPGYYRQSMTDTGPTQSQIEQAIFGASIHNGGGLAALANLDSLPMWIGTKTDTLWTNPYVDYAGLQPAAAQFFSFYSSAYHAAYRYGLRLPVSEWGVYGAEFCPNGIFQGSDTIPGLNPNVSCDPDNWYQPYGQNPNQARVGDYYNTRDVDCYDSNAWTLGPTVGLGHLRPDAICDRPDPILLPWIAGADANKDCIADDWQTNYGTAFGSGGPLRAAEDLDIDGATNLEEFRWRTIPIDIATPPGPLGRLAPLAKDYDSDDWYDGPEIHYWNYAPNPCAIQGDGTIVALYEPASFDDINHNGLPNQQDPDADGDGILDGTEVHRYRTYPEFADSDCPMNTTWGACPPSDEVHYEGPNATTPRGAGDGMNDSAELEHWNSTIWGELGLFKDIDGDSFATNLLDPDSDGDSIPDGQEMKAEDDQALGVPTAPSLQNVTKFWLFDTDNDTLLDGAGMNLSFEDTRYKAFTAEGICYRNTTKHTRYFYGETDAGTAPNDPDPASVCEELGGNSHPQPSYWRLFRALPNTDLPPEAMTTNEQACVLLDQCDGEGFGEIDVNKTLESGASIAQNATEDIAKTLERGTSPSTLAAASELTNQTLGALNGIIGCAKDVSAPVLPDVNASHVLRSLNDTITCTTQTVIPYASWLADRTTSTLTAKVGETLNATPIPSLLRNTASRVLSPLRENFTTEALASTTSSLLWDTLDVTGLGNATTASSPVTSPTTVSGALNVVQPQSRMPTFTYNTISTLGLSWAWPYVQTANQQARQNSGNLVDPVSTLDSLSFSVYAQSQMGPIVKQGTMGTGAVGLDINADGTDDLRAFLNMTTDVVQAQTTSTGTGLRVTPTIKIEKIDSTRAFNATVMAYMQVPNTQYVVALGYDSLQTDAPDTWTSTLQGFDAFETANRTFSYILTTTDTRSDVPLHAYAGAFQVDTSQSNKPPIAGRETASDVEGLTNLPTPLTVTTLHDRPSFNRTQFTITLAENATLAYRMTDQGTNINTTLGLTGRLGKGTSDFLALGARDRLVWHWKEATPAEWISLNATEAIGASRRAFTLTGSGLALPVSGSVNSVEFTAVRPTATYNVTSFARNVSFQQSEGDYSCQDMSTQRSLVIIGEATRYCAVGRMGDLRYVDFTPSPTSMGYLSLGAESSLNQMGLYLRDSTGSEAVLKLDSIGTNATVSHQPLPNGTRATTWTTNGETVSMHATLLLRDASPNTENVDVEMTNAPLNAKAWFDVNQRSVNVQTSSPPSSGTMRFSTTPQFTVLKDASQKPFILRGGTSTTGTATLTGVSRFATSVDENGALRIEATLAQPLQLAEWIDASDAHGYMTLDVPEGTFSSTLGLAPSNAGTALHITGEQGVHKFSFKGTTRTMSIDTLVQDANGTIDILLAPRTRSASITGLTSPMTTARPRFATPPGRLPDLEQGVEGIALQASDAATSGALNASGITTLALTSSTSTTLIQTAPERPGPFATHLVDSSSQRVLKTSARSTEMSVQTAPTRFDIATRSTQPVDEAYQDATNGTAISFAATQANGGVTLTWNEARDLAITTALGTGSQAATLGFEHQDALGPGGTTRAWRMNLTAPPATVNVDLTPTSGTANVTGRALDGQLASIGRVSLLHTTSGATLRRPVTWAGDTVYLPASTDGDYLDLRNIRQGKFGAPTVTNTDPLIMIDGTAPRDLFVEIHNGASEMASRMMHQSSSFAMSAVTRPNQGFNITILGEAPSGRLDANLADGRNRFIIALPITTPTQATVGWEPGQSFDLDASEAFTLELAYGRDGATIPWPGPGTDSLVLDATTENPLIATRLTGVRSFVVRPGEAYWTAPLALSTYLGAKLVSPAETTSFAMSPIANTGHLAWELPTRSTTLETSTTLDQVSFDASNPSNGRMFLNASSVPPGRLHVDETSPGNLVLESTGGSVGSVHFAWAPGGSTPTDLAHAGVRLDASPNARALALMLTNAQNAVIHAGDSTTPPTITITSTANSAIDVVLNSTQSRSIGSVPLGIGTTDVAWPLLDPTTQTRTASYSNVGPGKASLSEKSSSGWLELVTNDTPSTAVFTTNLASSIAWTPVGSIAHDLHAAWQMGPATASLDASRLAGGLNVTTTASMDAGSIQAPGGLGKLDLSWNPTGTTLPNVTGPSEALSIQVGSAPTVLARLGNLTSATWSTADTRASPDSPAILLDVHKRSASTAPTTVLVVHPAHQTRLLLAQGTPLDLSVSLIANEQRTLTSLDGAVRNLWLTHLTLTNHIVNLTLNDTGPLATASYTTSGNDDLLQVTGGSSSANFESNLNNSLLRITATSLPTLFRVNRTMDLSHGGVSTDGTGSVGALRLVYSPHASAAVATAKDDRDFIDIENIGGNAYLSFKTTGTSSLMWFPHDDTRPSFQVDHNAVGGPRDATISYNTQDIRGSAEAVQASPTWTVRGAASTRLQSPAQPRPHEVEFRSISPATALTAYEYSPTTNQAAWVQATGVSNGIKAMASGASGGLVDVILGTAAQVSLGAEDGNTTIGVETSNAREYHVQAPRAGCTDEASNVLEITYPNAAPGMTMLKIGDNKTVPKAPAGSHVALTCDASGIHASLMTQTLGPLVVGSAPCGAPGARGGYAAPGETTNFDLSSPLWGARIVGGIIPAANIAGLYSFTLDCEDVTSKTPRVHYDMKRFVGLAPLGVELFFVHYQHVQNARCALRLGGSCVEDIVVTTQDGADQATGLARGNIDANGKPRPGFTFTATQIDNVSVVINADPRDPVVAADTTESDTTTSGALPFDLVLNAQIGHLRVELQNGTNYRVSQPANANRVSFVGTADGTSIFIDLDDIMPVTQYNYDPPEGSNADSRYEAHLFTGSLRPLYADLVSYGCSSTGLSVADLPSQLHAVALVSGLNTTCEPTSPSSGPSGPTWGAPCSVGSGGDLNADVTLTGVGRLESLRVGQVFCNDLSLYTRVTNADLQQRGVHVRLGMGAAGVLELSSADGQRPADLDVARAGFSYASKAQRYVEFGVTGETYLRVSWDMDGRKDKETAPYYFACNTSPPSDPNSLRMLDGTLRADWDGQGFEKHVSFACQDFVFRVGLTTETYCSIITWTNACVEITRHYFQKAGHLCYMNRFDINPVWVFTPGNAWKVLLGLMACDPDAPEL